MLNGPVNESLVLTGQVSFDPDGDPLEYIWDFDASDGMQVDFTEGNRVLDRGKGAKKDYVWDMSNN